MPPLRKDTVVPKSSAWFFIAVLSAASCLVLESEVTAAVSPANAAGPSASVSIQGDAFPLAVIATDAMSVRLRWTPLPGAVEYAVERDRDGAEVGRTVATVGFYSDFDLRPLHVYRYRVTAYDSTGTRLGRSSWAWAVTKRATAIRTHYNVLAIAFNPGAESLTTESVWLRHRVQFLALASLGSARIDLYGGGIVSTPVTPDVLPGTNEVDYLKLAQRTDLGLGGHSIVDLVEMGVIDHVWVVKAPVDFAENTLLGNRPIQGAGATSADSWVPLPLKSSRSFFINAFQPDQRSYDAYAHMVEGIMTSISNGYPALWPRDSLYSVYTQDRSSDATVPAWLNAWERFRVTDGWNGTSPVAYASPGHASIGSSHFPATTPRTCEDYCYFDRRTWQRYVMSDADGWLRYPTPPAASRMLDGYDFGAFNAYAEGGVSYDPGTSPELDASFAFGSASYHQWWFGHLPHNPGVVGGMLDNWWPHLFDFNRFDGARLNYPVTGFPVIDVSFPPIGGEYGTDQLSAREWGYWNSENGFSPGGKAGDLSMVDKSSHPAHVKVGRSALKVRVENTSDLEELGRGRNDVFYPASRNAHWHLPGLTHVKFSIKPGVGRELLQGTNPILRLYGSNPGTRLEYVPRIQGAYANLLAHAELADGHGWYNFDVPVGGDATWQEVVIGYIDPSLSSAERLEARARLRREILADVNDVEVSIRSTTSRSLSPDDVVTYYIDDIELLER